MPEIPNYLEWLGLLFTIGAPSATVVLYSIRARRKHATTGKPLPQSSERDLASARELVGVEVAVFLTTVQDLGDPLRVIQSITAGVSRQFSLDPAEIPVTHSLEYADRILARQGGKPRYNLDELRCRAAELDIGAGLELEASGEALIPLIESKKPLLQIPASTTPRGAVRR
jgi:hypothetical protein